MTRTKYFSGMCPHTNSEQSISIDYLENSSLDRPTVYVKGRYSCENAMKCPNTSNCPLYENAPENI